MNKTTITAGLIIIIISLLTYSTEVFGKSTNVYTTMLFDACLLGIFCGSSIMTFGVIIKPEKPHVLEMCKCGKPGVHGSLKGDGKTRESYAECDACFEKNIRKMTLKCLKEAIHNKGLDICPACGLRGKHAPVKVKHCMRFYKCPNGHEWELKNETN